VPELRGPEILDDAVEDTLVIEKEFGRLGDFFASVARKRFHQRQHEGSFQNFNMPIDPAR
jgi:hypothetical protein